MSCPSQWDIFTEDNKYIYARYRWGHLTLTLNFGGSGEKSIFTDDIGDSLDGYMEDYEFRKITESILDWSEFE